MSRKEMKTNEQRKPKSLIFFCDEVKKYVQRKNDNISPYDLGNYKYELRNESEPLNGKAIHSENIIPMIRLKSNFLMYFSVSYTHEQNKFSPEEISLQFFDSSNDLLFRAEVSFEKKDNEVWHPQPHWHTVHTSKIDKPVAPNFMEYVHPQGFQTAMSSKVVDSGRIHLPMNINAEFEKPLQRWSENDAIIWVKNTLRVVSHELDFVTK